MAGFSPALTLGPEEKGRGRSVLRRTPAGSELHLAVLLSTDPKSEGPRWESSMKKKTDVLKVIYSFLTIFLFFPVAWQCRPGRTAAEYRSS